MLTSKFMSRSLRVNCLVLFSIRYCGHGNGQNCYPENNLRRIHCNAAALLMGCSSAQYRYHGPRSSSSSVLNAYATAMW